MKLKNAIEKTKKNIWLNSNLVNYVLKHASYFQTIQAINIIPTHIYPVWPGQFKNATEKTIEHQILLIPLLIMIFYREQILSFKRYQKSFYKIYNNIYLRWTVSKTRCIHLSVSTKWSIPFKLLMLL